MTAQSVIPKSNIKKFKTAAFALVGIISFCVFFFETPVIIERMKKGLALCSGVLIPTLFPFMVLSELLMISGIDRMLSKILGNILEKIFMIPRCATSAFILGLLCGFPVGTVIAYSLYDKGKISNDELLHLLLFCNIQSSAFIINTVGLSMLGSKNAGLILYASQIIALIVTGAAYPRIFPPKKSSIDLKISDKVSHEGLTLRFTRSIKSSVLSVLSICGFVLFFSVLCGIAFDLGKRLNIPYSITLILCSALEMSCGCLEVSETLHGAAALYGCTAVLGFSGISMHFQIMSLCKNTRVKYGRFFAVKIFSAAIAVIAAVILNFIFKIFV